MKLLLTLVFFLQLSLPLAGQEKLSLEAAQQSARENYPLIKRHRLIERTQQLSLDNATKTWLPQIQVVAQATYQNEVTQLPFSLPNLTVEPLSKDQYKAWADLQQILYDGGLVSAQKKAAHLSAGIEKQKTEVELDQLEERVNQLFFGILLTGEQIRQTKLTENDLRNGLRKAEVQLRKGVILRSQADVMKAQLITLGQKQLELETVRKNALDLLSVFLNRQLAHDTVLERPAPTILPRENKRPELQLFRLQQEAVEVQKSLLRSRNAPKIGAFFQGGYGKPGFNMLQNEFDLFYIGGIRLNIPFSGFYTRKNDLELLEIQQDELEVQKEKFLFNQQFQILQSDNELTKIQQLLESDNELILLRESILKAALAQLENGVINTSDYLRELNELDRARTQKIIHEIQYLQTGYNLKAQLNN